MESENLVGNTHTECQEVSPKTPTKSEQPGRNRDWVPGRYPIPISHTTFDRFAHISPRQTSLLSYLKLKEEGELGKKQIEVLKYIEAHPFCSDRGISAGLGMAINCVCGRRNELVKFGYVSIKGKKFDEVTKRDVIVWGV